MAFGEGIRNKEIIDNKINVIKTEYRENLSLRTLYLKRFAYQSNHNLDEIRYILGHLDESEIEKYHNSYRREDF